MILLLCLTTTLLQFSSTALLSDLRLGELPSLPSVRNATYDFVYTHNGSGTDPAVYHFSGYTYPIQLRTSTWLRPPPSFPAFAEYSRPVSSPDGVDDTGILLRAFLPFADAQSRESVRNYSGKATVLDSRVSCQRPQLSHISLGANSSYVGRISGKFAPSYPQADRLWTPGPLPFSCSTFLAEGATTICQVDSLSPFFDSYADNGGLLSEFWNATHNETRAVLESGIPLWSLPMLVIQAHNISQPTMSDKVLGIENAGVWTNIVTSGKSWRISACYSAFTTGDLHVNMHSNKNRTEPIMHWSPNRGYYTIPDVHEQLGDVQTTQSSANSRGILQLQPKSSWIPAVEDAIPPGVQPIVQQFVDVTNPLLSLCRSGAQAASLCSALLTPPTQDNGFFYQDYVYNANRDRTGIFVVDYSLSSFFQQTLGKNATGSLARAMSSLITMLSSMAYYDQMPQYAKTATSTQIYFSTVLFPQSYKGYWAVVIVLAVHVAVIGVIAIGFMICAQHTLFGNHWQTIAQLQGPETEDLLRRTRMATDGDVKRALRIAGYESVRVGVRSLNDGRSVGLSAVRHRTRSTDLEGNV